MVVIHHVLTSLHPTLSSHTWKDECVVSMSSSIRSSLRRDIDTVLLHGCSIFELVARLCARVDVIVVYVTQIRQKSSCPINYLEEVHLSPVDVALYTVVNQDRYNIVMHKPLCMRRQCRVQ